MDKRGRVYAREWRLYRGLTQQRLAGRLGVSQATVSRIENQNEWTRETLYGLAEAFDADITDLFRHPTAATEAEKLLRQMDEAQQRRALAVLRALADDKAA